MKVILIETTSESYRRNPLSQMARVLEPLGIEYIGAYIQRFGHEVELIHQITQGNDDILDQVVRSKPKVVGFSCMTYSYPDTVSLAESIKREMPDTKTILGGYHVLGMEVTPRCFDFVVKGEGEIATKRILDYLSGHCEIQAVPGLRFHGGEKLGLPREHSQLRHIENPIRLPRESYYSKSMGENLPDTRMACVVIGRGCTHWCDFCCTPQFFLKRKKSTCRSIDEVIDEIEELRDTLHVNSINVRDETLEPRSMVREFCSKLIQRKTRVSWRAFANIGGLDKTSLEMMAESGCHMLFYGIEASDPETLKLRRKNFPFERIYEDIKAAQKLGIFVRGGFIVGHENDTEQSFERHEQFLKQVCPDELYISFLTPFPGTPLFQRMEREQRLRTTDLRQYDCEHPVIDIRLPHKLLRELRDRLYRNFYASAEWRNHVQTRAHDHSEERETIRLYSAYIADKLGITDPLTPGAAAKGGTDAIQHS